MKIEESYPEFLRRVHRQDVESGRAIHRLGHCTICDEVHTERKGTP